MTHGHNARNTKPVIHIPSDDFEPEPVPPVKGEIILEPELHTFFDEALTKSPALMEPDVIDLGFDEPETTSPASMEVDVIDLGFDEPSIESKRTAELDSHIATPLTFRYVEIQPLLEHPFFSPAREPASAPRAYLGHKGQLFLRVEAQVPEIGLATLQDADLIIVLVSMMNMHRGSDRQVERSVTLPLADWLQLGRRLKAGARAGGRQYKLIGSTIDRLLGTQYTTNITPTGKVGPERTFTLLAGATRTKRTELTLTAADWLVEAVEANALLRLNPAYFDLSIGYARLLYRLARKHVGIQAGGCRMYDRTLWRKSGSSSPLLRFRAVLKRIIKREILPDYQLTWAPGGPGRDPMIRMRRDYSTTRR